MSYRLIDANKIQTEYPKVNELPCIYVDLPNGLDNSYHFITTDDINAAHEQIGYEKGYGDGYASAIEAEPIKHGKWIFNPHDGIEAMFTKPKCSVCGFESADGLNYCPNCGALMRGEEDAN